MERKDFRLQLNVLFMRFPAQDGRSDFWSVNGGQRFAGVQIYEFIGASRNVDHPNEIVKFNATKRYFRLVRILSRLAYY